MKHVVLITGIIMLVTTGRGFTLGQLIGSLLVFFAGQAFGDARSRRA